MKNMLDKEDMISLSGRIGIIAALVTILSDLILLGRPISGSEYFRLGTETMAELAQWRIIAGTFIGVFALPFQIAGIVPLYFGLRQAGSRAAAFICGTAAYTLILGVAFHASYAYIGSGWSMFYKIGAGSEAAIEIMSGFDLYWKIIIVAMFAGLFFSSSYYAILILSGKTLYPKWMAICNPVCIFLVIYPVILLIPAPLGGYIGPAALNYTALSFFIFVQRMKKMGKN